MSQKRPHEMIQLLSSIDPDNQSAGTVTGDYVKADDFLQYMAVFNAGVLTSNNTTDFSVVQATDGSGTGAKELKAATQLTQAGTDSDKQVIISFDASDMDTVNGFLWFAPRVVTATAAGYVCANVFGINPIYGYNTDTDLSSVDEIVD
jgi:hypothetical protein